MPCSTSSPFLPHTTLQTDVILRAFGACAASQGCMNNLTFGDANIGYYETICGGAGGLVGVGCVPFTNML